MGDFFINQLQQNTTFKELLSRIREGKLTCRCGGMWGASRALTAAALSTCIRRPILIIAGTGHEAEDFYADLSFFLGGEKRLAYFPASDVLPYETISPVPEIVHQRVDALYKILTLENPIVVVPVRAFLTLLPPGEAFVDASLHLKAGDLHELDELSGYLTALGYEQVPRVERPGEYSRKGGILDIFPVNLADPVRIEFFDIEVESIRIFSAPTQRSIRNIEEILILPRREILLSRKMREEAAARVVDFFPGAEGLEELKERIIELGPFPGVEFYLPLYYDNLTTLDRLFPEEPLLLYADEDSVTRNSADFLRDVQELFEGYFSSIKMKHRPEALFAGELQPAAVSFSTLAVAEEGVLALPFLSPGEYHGDLRSLEQDVCAGLAEGRTVQILVSYSGQAGRVLGLLKDCNPQEGIAATAGLMVGTASLSSGLRAPELGFEIILEREIFSRKRHLRRKIRTVHSMAVDSFLDLVEGEYVVHIQHGIGIFHGVERLSIMGKEKDYFKLEYRDNEKLFVPLEMINLVQRYLGADGKPPRLDSLGKRSWEKAREKVRRNVEELARELVKIYAARIKQKGHAFGADKPWQYAFESSFPFEETPDQQQAIEDVKRDMESEQPMDRLVCGDVGFGKTEVAIRAAFKAVMDGKQVVVLVPTTILAEQHYKTFSERYELYPVTVDYLSRFKTPAEQCQTLERLERGELDVVIGTHRLLSKDVKFKNAGLLVIDEEQRFGVEAKEELKKMRRLIDVLTLTATPIPRTLHLSLIKVRDLSTIRTPPMSRLPVETYVMEYNENMVKRAILQELDRGGQVFYLHNRVRTIEAVYHFLAKLVPRARIGIAHGQLPEHQLERVMHDFIDNRVDILLSTTIIESGLDIPNVNTLIVDRADLYGLAQLYQIRGRVGRASRQAYAWLFYQPDTPLTESAQKRLQVINEYTELGSGFHLAMRDMEIRGAGSVFGAEQSGDIIAVGFDMYCRLLDEAIREFKIDEEPEPVDTVLDLSYEGYIPESYISDLRQKIEVYKRIAACSTAEEVLALEREVRDRFGPIPDGVASLFTLSGLKAEGRRAGAKSILQRGNRIELEFDASHTLDPARVAALVQSDAGVRLVAGESALLTVEDRFEGLEDKVEAIKGVLAAMRMDGEELED